MRTRWLWLGCLGVCVLFWLWHAPLRSALSPSEIDERVAAADIVLPEATRAFFESDDGLSFYMINVLDHREKAVYPEGFAPEARTGAAAAALYAGVVVPELLKRGSYPIFSARQITTLMDSMAGKAERYEAFAIVRYRSRRDLLDMMLDSDFQAGLVHKWASLEGTVVIPAQGLIVPSLNLVVPLVLISMTWGIGVLRRRFG